MVEIAITVDGALFVKTTYTLEGDKPLARYKKSSELRAAITVAHFPNTQVVTCTLSKGYPTIQQQQFNYGLSCIQPAYDYFNVEFDIDLKETLEAFKVAGYFNPCKVTELKLSSSDVDKLNIFPFLRLSSIIEP